MSSTQQRQITGWLLILTPVLFMSVFIWLQMNFSYPDILREPTDVILRQFSAGGPALITAWYLFMFSALLFVPVAIWLHPWLARPTAPYVTLATTLGILAGLAQALGLIRWPVLVPILAQAYLDANASPATREAATVVFQAFHTYAGVTIGEQLGYLFTGGWTLLSGLAMLRSPVFRPWHGWIGMVLALGIIAGFFETLGMPLAGLINAVSYSLWAAWLLMIGLVVLRAKGQQPLDSHLASGSTMPVSIKQELI